MGHGTQTHRALAHKTHCHIAGWVVSIFPGVTKFVPIGYIIYIVDVTYLLNKWSCKISSIVYSDLFFQG